MNGWEPFDPEVLPGDFLGTLNSSLTTDLWINRQHRVLVQRWTAVGLELCPLVARGYGETEGLYFYTPFLGESVGPFRSRQWCMACAVS